MSDTWWLCSHGWKVSPYSLDRPGYRQEESYMAGSSERADFPAPPEDFLTYRSHRLVALFDDPDAVQDAIKDLVEAGFSMKDINVLSGPEGAAKLDVTGRHHGLRGRIYRFVEHVAGDEHEWLHEHSDQIARGRYGVAVSAGEESKYEASTILARGGAHDAAYFDQLHWHRM
jgi:hypothetical protein